MTPPSTSNLNPFYPIASYCLNCHNTPETPPNFSDPWESYAYSSFGLLGPACPAMTAWPYGANISQIDLQKFPWWVRNNYEFTRNEYYSPFTDHPRVPFRIDVGDAHLKIDVAFKPGDHVLKEWNGINLAELQVSPGGKLVGGLEVKDNQIPLKLKDLLQFNGVFFDGPANFNAYPERVSVGDFGELHFIGKMKTSALFFLDGFAVPRPPVGYDFPTAEQMQKMENNWDYSAWIYPDRRQDYSDVDYTLADKIPPELLEPDGRLPESYGLELLLKRIFKFLQNRPPPDPTKPSLVSLPKLLSYLEPGSKIELNLDQLKDFFIPGILDLGPSQLKAQLTVNDDKTLSLLVPEFQIQIEPMDYPTSLPVDRRGPIRLEDGLIRPGETAQLKEGPVLQPGLHLRYDPESGQVDIQGNLHLELSLEAPLLGEIHLAGHILLRTHALLQEGKLKLMPQSTTLEIKDINIARQGKTENLFSSGHLLVSDDPVHLDRVKALVNFNPEAPLAFFQLTGEDSDRGKIEFSGEVHIPLTAEGLYDFENILQLYYPLDMLLHVDGKKGGFYESKLSLSLVPVLGPTLFGPSEKAYQLSFDVDHATKDKVEKMVEKGKFFYQRVKDDPQHDHVYLGLSAEHFHHDQVTLKDVHANLTVDRARLEGKVTEIHVPSLGISANPKDSPEGLLRGPILIEQKNGDKDDLHLSWNGEDRQLKIEGLDLALDVQQVYGIPPPLKKILGPKAASVGLDGHITGHFTMNFPDNKKKWSGSGNLLVRGGRDGDIYWLGSDGKRFGPPFIRDTRWRFSKISRLNWDRRYALGQFNLQMILNTEALLRPGSTAPSSGNVPKAYSLSGIPLGPFEFEGQLPHDNMPWSAQGFKNRIVDYVITLCHQDTECTEKTRGKGGKE